MCKVRFFLLVLCVGIGCVSRISAMKLPDHQNQKNDVVVDITRRLWSREYSRNIREVPDVAGLKKFRETLVKERYLPCDVSPLNHLVYLSTIQKNDKSKSLFTQTQQNKFDTAESIKRWVGRCFGINAVVILGTSFAPFAAGLSFLQCANGTLVDCLSSTSTVLTPATIAMFAAWVVGGASLYATGISPDLASQKANKVQDQIGALRRQNLTTAKHLVDIYFDCSAKAQYLAAMFDIEELKARAQINTGKSEANSGLITPFEEACSYINKGELLEALTEIELYICNKINSRRIALLENVLLKQKTKKRNKKQEKI